MIELKNNKQYRLFLIEPFTSCYDFNLMCVKVNAVVLQQRFWFFGWRWRTIKRIKAKDANIESDWLRITFEV